MRGGFVGAVLTGGASSRMGTDKALVEVDGAPMALRVAAALRAAGADDVVCVGGDEVSLRRLGLRVVPDAYPGDGPLGGIITALRERGETVVISPCDMPWIEAAHVTALVDALEGHADADADADADVAIAAGQHLFGAWRADALPVLERAFADGERAPKRALALLRTIIVDLPAGAWSSDVDTPGDL